MESIGRLLFRRELSLGPGPRTLEDDWLTKLLVNRTFDSLRASEYKDSLTSKLDCFTRVLGNVSTLDYGPDRDLLTGKTRDYPLVGSFMSDPLTRSGPLDGQKTTSLPDLTSAIGKVKLPKTIAADDQGQVQVVVRNQGNQSATEPLELSIFASTDSILDRNDQLLSSLRSPGVNFLPSSSQTYTLDFTNPEGVAPGAYYLITDIDGDDAIAESNENNNLASARVSATGTDVVLDWNATLLNAVATDRTAPPLAARNMAMVHAGIYASVCLIDQLSNNGDVDTVAPEGMSRKAAAATAAHRILVNLYPTQTATFDTQLGLSLAEVANGHSENNSVALGRFVADLILAWRSTDGANNLVSYTPRTKPGDWQPTPPDLLPALLPQWPDVTPFAITSGSQFRPEGPPALDSTEYTADFNQVKALGSFRSTTRTADQTEIAQFWADGAGTFTPPGHWNLIAERVCLAEGNTLSENARLFALLNVAEADAGIVAWDAKYEYNFWRPITAIQQANTDGNPDTTVAQGWASLLTTPPFPEYVSGHSAFSGAADAVLTSFFGDISFTTTSVGLPGVVRSYDSFTEAADEAGISRIYGGIHFQSANEDGLAMGRAVGNSVVQDFLA